MRLLLIFRTPTILGMSINRLYKQNKGLSFFSQLVIHLSRTLQNKLIVKSPPRSLVFL